MLDIKLTKDNFIKKKSEVFNLNKQQFETIFKLLKENWPYIRISEIHEIDRKKNILDSNSQNFFLKDHNYKFYLLKKISFSENQYNLYEQFKIQDWCSENIFSVPKIFKNNKIQIATKSMKSIWVLMEYIEGEYFSGSNNQIQIAGSLVGQLHQALRDLPKIFYPTKTQKNFFTNEEKNIYKNLLDSKNNWENFFDKVFCIQLIKFEHIIDKIWKRINEDKRILNFPYQVVHYDLHPLNLIFSNNRNTIIDFGSIRFATIEQALGFNLIKLSKRVLLNRSLKNSTIILNDVKKNWLIGLKNSLNYEFNFDELILFGQAEIFRRFLSMTNKSFMNEKSIFNGPLTHLESLILSEELDN